MDASELSPPDWPRVVEPFATARLLFRPLAEQDETLYCDLFCDPPTMRFIGPPLTRKQTARNFRAALASARTLPPRALYFALVAQASQETVGLCTLQNLDLPGSTVQLGMMLRAEARAQGLAKEAVTGIAAHVFARLPIERIWAEFAPEHAAAAGSLLGGGFSHDEGPAGTARRHIVSLQRKSHAGQSRHG